MFGLDITKEGSRATKIEKIEVLLAGKIADDTFRVTELLIAKEPERTEALMLIDGIALQDGSHVPVSMGTTHEMPDVTLVYVGKDDGQITHGKIVKKRVLGSDRVKQVKEVRKLGKVATVSHAIARDILDLFGMPVLDIKTNGNREGTVAEWQWLQEHKEDDGIAEIYARAEKVMAAVERTEKKAK
jgi:hypothetical protein